MSGADRQGTLRAANQLSVRGIELLDTRLVVGVLAPLLGPRNEGTRGWLGVPGAAFSNTPDDRGVGGRFGIGGNEQELVVRSN